VEIKYTSPSTMLCSTMAAAPPVSVLLVLMRQRQVQGQLAAIVALVSRHSHHALSHAHGMSIRASLARVRVRIFPDRRHASLNVIFLDQVDVSPAFSTADGAVAASTGTAVASCC